MRFPLETLYQKFQPTLCFARALSSGGQTVCHLLPTSTKPVDNTLGGEFGVWIIRKVVHPTGSNPLVDNPEVEETTMNRNIDS